MTTRDRTPPGVFEPGFEPVVEPMTASNKPRLGAGCSLVQCSLVLHDVWDESLPFWQVLDKQASYCSYSCLLAFFVFWDTANLREFPTLFARHRGQPTGLPSCREKAVGGQERASTLLGQK